MSNRIHEDEGHAISASRRQLIGAGGCAAVASVVIGAMSGSRQVRADDTSANEAVVREFIAAWSKLDTALLVNYFTEDGVYHNMMLAPVAGRDNLLKFIGGFLKNWSETRWEVINLVAHDDLVFAERVDHTRIGERRVALPCVGVFEMHDGKIKIWRDYFDLETYRKAFAA